MGLYSSQSCVQSQLSHWDTHALDTKVPQAKDSFSVSNHNGPDIIFRPVTKNVIDVTFIMDGDEQAL